MRGFKYACNSHLYSQYSKKTGVMYLKCDTADCKATAQIDQGLLVQYMQIPRRPIYCQNPLLADSITCKFIQPHRSHWPRRRVGFRLGGPDVHADSRSVKTGNSKSPGSDRYGPTITHSRRPKLRHVVGNRNPTENSCPGGDTHTGNTWIDVGPPCR